MEESLFSILLLQSGIFVACLIIFMCTHMCLLKTFRIGQEIKSITLIMFANVKELCTILLLICTYSYIMYICI